MEFKKYNSIENSYQIDFITSIFEQNFNNLTYIVQEKVHGANLSFITDGQSILTAKRTDLILKNEDFFNYETVLSNYKDRILNLYQAVVIEQRAKIVTIFGEIFGGGYPHSEITNNDKAKLVQRGIYYCPQNEFYAFDILLDNSKYLDTELANVYFERFGFYYAKTLFKGNLSDCLAYPNTFKTTIPYEFNLPEIDGNICEGIIIRPTKTTFFQNGSRLLIKNKNEKWAENNNYIDKAILSKMLHSELSEEATLLCEEIYKLITQNRLDNVLSKIGNVNPKKDLGKILGLYNKDVLSDFNKMFSAKLEALEKHDNKAVTKFLNVHAGQLINDYFDNK